MSVGDLKTEGNKGNNFPWQLKMLLGQQCACDSLTELVNNTDTVEPLLAQILAAVQQGTDYEAALVVDANDDTWLEIRVWNGVTFDPPVYYLAGSNTAGTPVAPITYINPNTYLAQIVSNTTGLATETTLLNIDGTIATLATEATLLNIETNTTGTLKTPQYVVASNFAGTINVAVTSISFANNSSVDADITVDGVNYNVLPAGVTVNFDAGAIGNYYAANTFAYDTLSYPGSSIIIIYNEF
jgi:hypothetical protein